MKKITFIELYKSRRNEPTPLQRFVSEVAEVTKKSEVTVKQWAMGLQAPDELTRNVIADHFGCDPDWLFPNKKERRP